MQNINLSTFVKDWENTSQNGVAFSIYIYCEVDFGAWVGNIDSPGLDAGGTKAGEKLSLTLEKLHGGSKQDYWQWQWQTNREIWLAQSLRIRGKDKDTFVNVSDIEISKRYIQFPIMLIYIAIKNWVCRTLVRDPFIEEAVLWPIQPIYSQKLPLIASMNIGAGNIMIYMRVS